MSDFPRGWIQSNAAVGSTVTVTAPALPGVVHVLDSVWAKIDASGTAGPLNVNASSSGGSVSQFLGRVFIGTAGGTDEFSLSGLDLAAGPGESLTVAFNGSGAGVGEALVAQGHDI
jgi:hypothetical protein